MRNVPEASRTLLLRRCRLALAALYEKMNQQEKVEALYQEKLGSKDLAKFQ